MAKTAPIDVCQVNLFIILVCPIDSYADNSNRLCVADCPKFPETYADYSSHRCVSICPNDPDLYADPISRKCVLRCPTGYYA